MTRAFKWLAVFLIALALVAAAFSYRRQPGEIAYGMTFSPLYAEEIGIDWKTAFEAMLEDLGVKRLRLSAYWPMIEPAEGAYTWSDMDYQITRARAHGATVILGVGKRLPRWPECHIPQWAENLSLDAEQVRVLAYIKAVVLRYKTEPAVTMWQIENEPYLRAFAEGVCDALDEEFLQKEIDLVRSLDSRPILLTDSGNLGAWAGAYKRSDVFGTSIYLYFWNKPLGAFRTILPPAYYRVKANFAELFFGKRPIILSELSLEPWLAASIGDVPLSEQLSRMNIGKFDEIVNYARSTRIGIQYLWGVEWWYYMKTKEKHAEFWDAGRALFKKNPEN